MWYFKILINVELHQKLIDVSLELHPRRLAQKHQLRSCGKMTKIPSDA